MALKGIDISSYQGKPDWNRIKVDFAIFRITERYGTDSSFEYNYQNCPYPKGVYKFSYALNIAEIKQEAVNVVNVLSGRPLQFPVFLDLEWNQQKALSKTTLYQMIEAFREIIIKAGYRFGIYCNVDWYKNYIPEQTKAKNYDFWIASYPAKDTGKMQERLKPFYGVGWQYSSKGTVNGIQGNVDMDVFYKDYESDVVVIGKPEPETIVIDPGTTAQDVVNLAQSYIGCNEADGSHRQIIDGYNAHRPLARGYVVQYHDSWCDTFVSFLFIKLGATNLIGGTECGVEEHVKLFQRAGIWIEDGTITPQPGDIIVFNWDDNTQPNDGFSDHIGIVESVGGGKIVTIEGNYSDAVKRRVLSVGDGNIRGYARPKYGKASVSSEKTTQTAQTVNSTTKPVEVVVEASSTPNKVPRWVGRVTANILNVRSWAGIENTNIKSYPVLKYGNLIDVCDTVKDSNGADWYYVRIAGQFYGFVSAQYVTRN